MQFLLKNSWILILVFVQIDRYVSLHQNGPSNYTYGPLKDWLQPVLHQSLNFYKIQATATGPITAWTLEH